jgi:lipoprotein-anchoring transpeptidase ErfK/SrfK
MHVREQSALVVAMVGLTLLAGPAAAQSSYTYPQGGYRGVTGPDGVMTRAPEGDENARPLPPRGAPAPGSAPYAERQPYYPTNQEPGRDAAPYPIEPRYGRQAPPPIAAPEPYPEPQIIGRPPGYNAPGYGSMPPYDERANAPGVITANPDPVQPGLRPPGTIEQRPPAAIPAPGMAHPEPGRPANLAALPPEDQPEEGDPKELPPQFRKQVVNYQTKEPAGTIIIDTPSTFLYYVNGDGTAVRYGIGVGREGFTWSGTERVSRMAEWPDWHPPAEMIERQPYLPRFMAGGPGNPLGARALYLGKTIYRVHGTNQPSTIGKFVSSGCIRMLNDDVEDLYTRVKVGTKVVVHSGGRGPSASNAPATR